MPVAQITNTRGFKYTWTNTLNYSLTLKEKHDFSFLLGQEVQHTQTTTNYQASRYFPRHSPRYAFNNMGLGSAYATRGGVTRCLTVLHLTSVRSTTTIAQVLLCRTMRADGSTRFTQVTMELLPFYLRCMGYLFKYHEQDVVDQLKPYCQSFRSFPVTTTSVMTVGAISITSMPKVVLAGARTQQPRMVTSIMRRTGLFPDGPD